MYNFYVKVYSKEKNCDKVRTCIYAAHGMHLKIVSCDFLNCADDCGSSTVESEGQDRY